MRHALIIDASVSAPILERLLPLGIRSFDHSWTAAEALAAARRHRPDLVIVGDSGDAARALEAIRTLLPASPLTVLRLSGSTRGLGPVICPEASALSPGRRGGDNEPDPREHGISLMAYRTGS